MHRSTYIHIYTYVYIYICMYMYIHMFKLDACCSDLECGNVLQRVAVIALQCVAASYLVKIPPNTWRVKNRPLSTLQPVPPWSCLSHSPPCLPPPPELFHVALPLLNPHLALWIFWFWGGEDGGERVWERERQRERICVREWVCGWACGVCA